MREDDGDLIEVGQLVERIPAEARGETRLAKSNKGVSMASIGRHHHLDVDECLRTETRAVYEGVLGGKLTSLQENAATGGAVLARETDVEIFTFDDGASIATFYVPSERALSREQHLHALWLEFEVNDVDRATAELADLGIEPLDYEDETHPYFQAPGGQVFRLAGS